MKHFNNSCTGHMDWGGEADTFFPTIDSTDWEVTAEAPVEDSIAWTYRKYERKYNE
jgi:hypothetical protein